MACICDTTIRKDCTYHGILHAPTRAALRRIWPLAHVDPLDDPK